MELTPTEMVRRDLALGDDLGKQLDSQVRLKQDKELLVYLRALAEKLAAGMDELKSSAVGVLIVEDRGARWRDYSIPGNRIYLSAGLLRRVQYENELAAAIAAEFGHLINRSLANRMLNPANRKGAKIATDAADPLDFPSIQGLVPSSSLGGGGAAARNADFFSPTGAFAFTDEEVIATVGPAVEVLYRAGYDPRGLVALWETYRANPTHSPHEQDLLRKLADKTRLALAAHSPLRNPIVRSAEFIRIQKRMQRL